MQQGSGLTCSCIGNFFSAQQKLFLSRKKEVDDIQVSSSRKSNKSTEMKNQSEVKHQKKSLKKRTLSNVSVQTPSTPFVHSQYIDHDQKMNQHDSNKSKDYSFTRLGQNTSNQARIIYNYVANPKNTQEVWRQKPYNKLWQQKNYRPSTPVILPEYFPHNLSQTPPAKRFQPNFRNTQYVQNQNSEFYGSPQSISHSNNLPQQKQNQKHIQKIHYLSKDSQKETESWMNIKQEQVLIEQFDSFFKNKEEHQSLANLSQSNKSFHRPREQQRFKRPQKPQLIGRFAESDDQSVSQSAPSQVIGKGFDSTLYDFWDNQQSNNAKETLASRSTNTKFSELNKFQVQERVRPKFGTVTSFKSYKYL